MGKPIRILMVEDNPEDAELLLRELRRAGYTPDWLRVDTEPEFLANLAPGYDLVLSDYAMPQFGGLRALELLTRSGLEIPFILVSGTIGEDVAVAAMRDGAADYLLKDRLVRLGPAVAQALEQGQARRQRRQAEEMQARFAAVVEFSDDAIISKTVDGIITGWNPGAEKLFGYGACETVGRSILLLFPPDRMNEEREILARVARGEGVSHFETVRVTKGGRHLEVSMTISPLRDGAGKIIGVSTIARDITERKRLEAQFRQAQKMEAIGQLAGGVAHDFNNILTVIHCNASLLLDTTGGPDSEASALARQIIESAERAAGLTRQLLLFSRKQAMEMADLDLREIVQNLAVMLARLLGEDIALVTDCAPNLPPVRGDRTMFEQVLLNLVVNSRDAMPGGGRLTLATALVTLGSGTPPPGSEATPGTYVRLSVTDTGTGIAPEHLPHIFEPFFTTKEVGKGTGLGLATVYGIVKQHRGWIELKSALGEGTTFHVHFPVAERPVVARPAAAPSNELPRGHESVLVVEDEPALRSLAKLVLQRCGYTVFEAGSGVSALKVWAAQRDQIRLLLTDMVMPDGMTGGELAARLQVEDPGLKVILTSGYSAEATDTAATGFLAKPYSPIKLARIVRECLDRK